MHPNRSARARTAVALTPEAVERFGRKAKALRLAVGDTVVRLDHLSVGLREVFLVEGDSGRYRTTLYGTPGGPRSASCTCPARGLCSHMLAAKALSEVTLALTQDQAAAAVIA